MKIFEDKNKEKAILSIKLKDDGIEVPETTIKGNKDDLLHLLGYLVFKLLDEETISKDDVMPAILAGMSASHFKKTFLDDDEPKTKSRIRKHIVVDNLDDLQKIIDKLKRGEDL